MDLQLGRYRIAPDGGAGLEAPPTPGLGADWVQFGDEMIVYADDAAWPGVAARAASSNLELAEVPAQTTRDRLHLVVQKGRLFQHEHPDVPVLVDKGRYLLVDIAPEQAAALAAREEPCYAVHPLESRLVAFDFRAAPALAAPPLPWVQEIVNRVALASFRAELEHLVAFPTRLSTSSHYDAASLFALAQFQTLGYEAHRESITVGVRTSHNVIATRPGVAGAADLVLVSAHLDSINAEDGPAAPAPGADDDGSGSAGVLEIARALAAHQGRHDLTFLLFGGEEQGLHGSHQYVAALDGATRARIKAVVNMDMIGCKNTATPTVLLEGASLSQSVIDGLADAASTYTGLTVQTSLNPFNSDHVSFINAGIPAVLTIEGADGANTHIHTARDTLDRIDFDLALDLLRMNTAYVATSVGTV